MDNRLKESWVGGCQPTVHGGIKDGETEWEALLRETQEELGERFIEACMGEILTGNSLVKISNDDEVKVKFAAFIPMHLIKEMRLGPQSGGLRLITPEHVCDIVDLRKFEKSQVIGRDITAMFQDDKEALERAFMKVIPKSVA